MAVVTVTAAGIGRVVGVGLEVVAKRFVTLQAGLIRIHAGSQLIVRITRMHGVTRKAGEFTVGVAGRLDVGIVFITPYSARAILPENIGKRVICIGREIIEICKGEVVVDVFIAGPELYPLDPGFITIVRLAAAVASCTNHHARLLRAAGRIDDRRIRSAREMMPVAVDRILMKLYVFAARAVACFTGDAEVGHTAVGHHRRLIEAGNATGAVAVDAVAVPVRGIASNSRRLDH